MENGWIRLHRRLREHPFWPTDRPYSKLEAWLDLILSANHKPASVSFDFNIIQVARGQCMTSQVKLAKRWGWHRETVSKFLRLLEREKMASSQASNKTSSGFTLITIQNYEKYQGVEGDETDSQTGSAAAAKPAAERQPSGTNKNDKNEKKIGRRKAPPLVGPDPRAVQRVIDRINGLSGKSYHADAETVCKGLSARLLAGATEMDCITVVEDRWRRWQSKPDMLEHFNPITLFRSTNYEKYLTEARANANGNAAQGGFVG